MPSRAGGPDVRDRAGFVCPAHHGRRWACGVSGAHAGWKCPKSPGEVRPFTRCQRRVTMSSAWDATKDAGSVAVRKVKDAG